MRGGEQGDESIKIAFAFYENVVAVVVGMNVGMLVQMNSKVACCSSALAEERRGFRVEPWNFLWPRVSQKILKFSGNQNHL